MAGAVDRFGRIDVLVNNAGNFNAGFFEELSPEEFRAQIETTLFGPVNVTRAALPKRQWAIQPVSKIGSARWRLSQDLHLSRRRDPEMTPIGRLQRRGLVIGQL